MVRIDEEVLVFETVAQHGDRKTLVRCDAAQGLWPAFKLSRQRSFSLAARVWVVRRRYRFLGRKVAPCT